LVQAAFQYSGISQKSLWKTIQEYFLVFDRIS